MEKQGIGSVYVMVDFICMGLLALWETRVEQEFQNQTFLPKVGVEPCTFRLRSDCATISDIVLISTYKLVVFYLIERFKFTCSTWLM